MECGKLRTFGSLQENYAAYVAAGERPKDLSKFKNCKNECLIKAELNEMVGEKCPLPELHLHMGIVNHYRRMLLQVWPDLSLWGRGKWTVHGRYGGGLDGVNSLKYV